MNGNKQKHDENIFKYYTKMIAIKKSSILDIITYISGFLVISNVLRWALIIVLRFAPWNDRCDTDILRSFDFLNYSLRGYTRDIF